MIRPPGLNFLVVNQMFIYGSSPPTMNWQVTTALPHSFETIPHAVFVLLFHSTYFHFFPRATLPLVSAWGSQVPFLLHGVQTKKGNSSLHLDGCGSQQNIQGFGQYDNSRKEATHILQTVPATDIPISCQALGRGRRQRGEANPEHEGPPHDLDEMSLWHSRLFLSASSSSPESSFLRAKRFTHFLQEVFHD